MSDEMLKASMEIILHAGNAKNSCAAVLQKLQASDYMGIDEHMKKAEEEILQAHKIHTEYLQKCIQEESNEFTLLLTHAQDTLMTANTEIDLTKCFVNCFFNIEKRLNALER